ncbi:mannose-1-phosphate guanylyltransferase [candidate division KSB1 bacterium]|nr:MAG: mannose-1-phosphate guanylyltransferase [candidate division KSB1 bacterium]
MLHSVIMAGGVGVRFWPLSRRRQPKQLLDLLGEGTLIEQTVARIEPIIPKGQRWIVTNREQMAMFREAAPEARDQRFILEPMGRNTAPAIGLAAIHLLSEDPDAVMIVLPADHRIENIEEFRRCLMTAVDLVSNSDILATIGIEPTRPETGYGYIQVDRSSKLPAENAFRVKTFAEKPNMELARRFFESGEFVWNSGIFIWRADVIMQQLAEHLPQWYSGLQEIAGALGTPQEDEVTKQIFGSLKGISIDYGVMERAPRVVVVRSTFRWSDVGSWDEVWRLIEQDADGNSCRGNTEMVDSRNNLVLARDKLVALVGVKDLIVVDAGDAILICPRDESQQVRAMVEQLAKTGREEYL